MFNLQRRFSHSVLAVAMAAVVGICAIVPRAARAQVAAVSVPVKIGIIGSGNIGGALGKFWAKAGHQVMFSSRHPEELKGLVDSVGPRARAGSVKEAIAFGDVILIAVPYGAMDEISKDYAKDFVGKIVMDTGNAVLARDGEIGKEAREKGVGLTTARLLPGAKVVRAFNTLGVGKLQADANRAAGRIGIPMAGDDAEALRVASGLVRDAGFDPAVLGGLNRSQLFEQTHPLYGLEISAEEMIAKAKALP